MTWSTAHVANIIRSGQLDTEGVVEAIGPVRLPDGGRKLHQVFIPEFFLQSHHDLFVHLRLSCELLGECDHRFRQFAVSVALRVVVELFDLLLGQPSPLTEDFVVVNSVMAFIDQARFQVRELAELGVESALKGRGKSQCSVENIGSVGHDPKNVRHHLQLCVELFEGCLRGCRRVFITDGLKYGHMSFLSC